MTVVTYERPAAVARAVPSGVGAGVTHKVAVSLGEECRSKDTCWGQRQSVRAALANSGQTLLVKLVAERGPNILLLSGNETF